MQTRTTRPAASAFSGRNFQPAACFARGLINFRRIDFTPRSPSPSNAPSSSPSRPRPFSILRSPIRTRPVVFHVRFLPFFARALPARFVFPRFASILLRIPSLLFFIFPHGRCCRVRVRHCDFLPCFPLSTCVTLLFFRERASLLFDSRLRSICLPDALLHFFPFAFRLALFLLFARSFLRQSILGSFDKCI